MTTQALPAPRSGCEAEAGSETLRHVLTPERRRPDDPPGGVVDVLVASKGGRRPAGLEHVPWEARVLVDSRPGWVHAANALLDEAADTGHDALFVDDDVTILPETFEGFARYYPLSDVFGFRLRGRPGEEQVGWGLQKTNPYPGRACYLAHVTASLMYVRHAVLAAGVRFPVWPGLHFEDIQFTYDCWRRGFAVAYLPLPALHDLGPAEGGHMLGATKRHEPDVARRRATNHRCLDRWAEKVNLRGLAEDGRIPFGVWGIDP
jgi:hypothetical protein